MKPNSNITDSELIYGNDCPYIYIQWPKGRIFVSNATFRLIGKPSGIRFLWNAAKRSLIIKPTDIEDIDGFPIVGKRYAQVGSLFIGSITLIEEIWAVTNWDKTLRYRIVAKYNESSNIAIFEMKDATVSEIPKDIRRKKTKQSNLEIVT